MVSASALLLSFAYLFAYLSIIAFFFLFYYRSDPTENDSVEGLRPNARGPGLVTFGVRSVVLLVFNSLQ